MTTRAHNSTFHCPNCGCWQTQESSFGRWIRNNSALDAQSGYCVIDQDYWVHRFKTFRGREFQLLMCVEVKTLGASLSDAQRDTLHVVNQVLRNRRQTPTKDLMHQAGSAPLTVYSSMAGRKVVLRSYGMHVLSFSGLGPDDSASVKWNRNVIDVERLTALLAFDLDPDTLRPLDLRNHHTPSQISMVGLEQAAD